jgi:hypothetical protein
MSKVRILIAKRRFASFLVKLFRANIYSHFMKHFSLIMSLEDSHFSYAHIFKLSAFLKHTVWSLLYIYILIQACSIVFNPLNRINFPVLQLVSVRKNNVDYGLLDISTYYLKKWKVYCLWLLASNTIFRIFNKYIYIFQQSVSFYLWMNLIKVPSPFILLSPTPVLLFKNPFQCKLNTLACWRNAVSLFR